MAVLSLLLIILICALLMALGYQYHIQLKQQLESVSIALQACKDELYNEQSGR